MKWIAYLNFDGRCKEAFEFYAQCFGVTLETMAFYRDMPGGGCSEAMANNVMHARLTWGDQTLMGSDSPQQLRAGQQGGCTVIAVDTPADADRIFGALADGGQTTAPLAETFFASRFGLVTDRFGTSWIVLCEKRV